MLVTQLKIKISIKTYEMPKSKTLLPQILMKCKLTLILKQIAKN